jgi:hypothetical protein
VDGAGAAAGAAGVVEPKKSGSFGRLNDEKKEPDFFSGAAV